MTGHLFVLHGRIESLVHDAAIISSDDRFKIEDHWKRLSRSYPKNPAPWAEPEDWPQRGWGRVSDEVWAVSIGGSSALEYEAILNRLSSVLQEIATTLEHEIPKGDRALPLIALPFIGLGGTGYGDQRGEVISDLLDWADENVAVHNIDLALVTPESSVYAAAQQTRLQNHASEETSSPDAARSPHGLAKLARMRGLALLTGAGIGVPAGLPTWPKLLERLSTDAEGLDVEAIKQLSLVDQATLIEMQDQEDFRAHVGKIIREATTPSLLHVLLAGLNIHEVVTTNYDTLYEDAVASTDLDQGIALPWTACKVGDPWILKLHGDVNHQDDIILTRRHMLRYDADNRPSGSVLQTLLLTRHVLMIGVSLTDDNVIRLASEVQDYQKAHHLPAKILGTHLDVSGDDIRAKLWEKQISWVPMEGETLPQRARSLELFLDEMAMHASEDSAWVLDPRFAGLLAPDEQTLAEEARSLATRLDGEKWKAIKAVLKQHGAPTTKSE